MQKLVKILGLIILQRPYLHPTIKDCDPCNVCVRTVTDPNVTNAQRWTPAECSMYLILLLKM